MKSNMSSTEGRCHPIIPFMEEWEDDETVSSPTQKETLNALALQRCQLDLNRYLGTIYRQSHIISNLIVQNKRLRKALEKATEDPPKSKRVARSQETCPEIFTYGPCTVHEECKKAFGGVGKKFTSKWAFKSHIKAVTVPKKIASVVDKDEPAPKKPKIDRTGPPLPFT